MDAKLTGLKFDGVHWKGYEDGVMTYDSYQYNVQLQRTNNYCQSYAAFLFAWCNISSRKL